MLCKHYQFSWVHIRSIWKSILFIIITFISCIISKLWMEFFPLFIAISFNIVLLFYVQYMKSNLMFMLVLRKCFFCFLYYSMPLTIVNLFLIINFDLINFIATITSSGMFRIYIYRKCITYLHFDWFRSIILKWLFTCIVVVYYLLECWILVLFLFSLFKVPPHKLFKIIFEDKNVQTNNSSAK